MSDAVRVCELYASVASQGGNLYGSQRSPPIQELVFVCDRISVYRVLMGAWQPNSDSELLKAEATALDIRKVGT
jgi:hypothetical protein